MKQDIAKTTEIGDHVLTLELDPLGYRFEHTLEGMPLRKQVFASLKIAIKVFNETELEMCHETND